ncbi:adrenodoxin-like protein 1, mitochondrial [Oppia nitens]|uniref:adrenodoxin-like protein 1, mitochondrial n=1 Tax=Oppia nitens TaxID=1686743 RepID=UPI0023DACE10|nr:adrenodoxin-like protein 1, mitochondrial [Oppia nitens]
MLLCLFRHMLSGKPRKVANSAVSAMRPMFVRKISGENTGKIDPKESDDQQIVDVIYVSKTGQRTHVKGKVGDNAMYLAHNNNVEIEGACEASLACCTCHVYVSQQYYNRLPQSQEEEEDMLDMAPFLKANSRLSCQIILTKELSGIELTLPPATRNFYVDGKKPTPH